MTPMDAISPETLQFIQECAAAHDDVPALVGKARRAMEEGLVASHHDMDDAELDHWFGIATDLCNGGRFSEALTIAINLTLRAPLDHRYSFMLGSCLQRMGRPREALGLFAVSMHAQDSAAACFRLAECHAACEEIEQAIQAFDRSAVLARGNDALAGLRERALSAAQALWESHDPAPRETAAA